MTNKTGQNVVIVGAVRTPAGRLGGALSAIRPDDLAAMTIRGLLEQFPQVDAGAVADVYLGCANQAGEDNRNVARMAGLLAGLPDSVPGATLNRLCASGLEAVNCAARCILAGEGDIYIAGGVESMSRAPWVLPKSEKAFPFGNLTAFDTALGWRFPNPALEKIFPLQSMGETAENIADRFKISRADQDAFALQSHERAAAVEGQVFKDEIVPVTVKQRKGPDRVIDQDETVRRDSSLEALAGLRPVFRKGGSVTAGNSSSLNDGAAALLLMASGRAKDLGLKPLAAWKGSAASGVDPLFMGLGPIAATKKLLQRCGMKLSDLDLVEINEAFAVQTLACAKELGLGPDRLNVNGGAIALGHPLGCSGARILTTLLHEMRRRGAKHGLASLCVGVGQGLSTLVEAE